MLFRSPTREPRWGLMVGDTEFDILAGRAAGMRTCAVAWSEIPRARLLDAAPDHFAESFTHITDLGSSHTMLPYPPPLNP